MGNGSVTIGYSRVSTTVQVEEGYSLEAQRKKIVAYCDLHDLELTEIVEDAGLSGKNIAGRPGILKVLEMVKTGKVVNVVVLKLDRLARNVKEAVEIADLLQKKGVALHSISEKLDTGSASGRLFYGILSCMAQWERETIGERTKTALSVKKDKGQRVSRFAPYGHDFTLTGELVANESEQLVLKKVRALKAQGYSVRGIIGYLGNHGVTNRRGRAFGVREVWNMIQDAA